MKSRAKCTAPSDRVVYSGRLADGGRIIFFGTETTVNGARPCFFFCFCFFSNVARWLIYKRSGDNFEWWIHSVLLSFNANLKEREKQTISLSVCTSCFDSTRSCQILTTWNFNVNNILSSTRTQQICNKYLNIEKEKETCSVSWDIWSEVLQWWLNVLFFQVYQSLLLHNMTRYIYIFFFFLENVSIAWKENWTNFTNIAFVHLIYRSCNPSCWYFGN